MKISLACYIVVSIRDILCLVSIFILSLNLFIHSNDGLLNSLGWISWDKRWELLSVMILQ